MTVKELRTPAVHARLVALAVAALAAASASAQQSVVLYGASHGARESAATSSLYVIDPSTAAATLVGPIDDPSFPGQIRSVTGLAFLDNGRLVGAANGDLLPDCLPPGARCAALVEINPYTAAATLIGLIGSSQVANQCGRATDLTYDPTTATLFAWGGRCVDSTPDSDQLLIVSPTTGLGMEVGETGFFSSGNSLARDPSSGTLFATPGPDFVTLDPTTGAGTVVPGSSALPEKVSGLDFHPLTRVLYGAEIDGTLVTIDTATGAVSVEGEVMVGADPVDAFDALAFQERVCAAAPLPACLGAGKASLAIVEKKAGSEKLKAKLKGFDGATAQSDLGAPVVEATRYDLCLYDAAAKLVAELSVDRAGENCGPKPCFKDKGGKGWLYKDTLAQADGTKKLVLGSGPIGKGKALWQAGNKVKKDQAEMPTGIATSLTGATSATLQLIISDNVCLEASFGTVKRADGALFKAKAP